MNKIPKEIKWALQTGVLSKLDATKILNIAKYGKLTCELCGQPINSNNDNKKASIDHIIPTSKGGPDIIENYQIAHRRCNMLKSNHTVHIDKSRFIKLNAYKNEIVNHQICLLV